MRTTTTRTITGRVNSDGTVAAIGSGGWTGRKTATGTYQLDFLGQRLLGCTVTNSGNGGTWSLADVDTLTGSGCRVIHANPGASALIDVAFTFTATVAA